MIVYQHVGTVYRLFLDSVFRGGITKFNEVLLHEFKQSMHFDHFSPKCKVFQLRASNSIYAPYDLLIITYYNMNTILHI